MTVMLSRQMHSHLPSTLPPKLHNLFLPLFPLSSTTLLYTPQLQLHHLQQLQSSLCQPTPHFHQFHQYQLHRRHRLAQLNSRQHSYQHSHSHSLHHLERNLLPRSRQLQVHRFLNSQLMYHLEPQLIHQLHPRKHQTFDIPHWTRMRSSYIVTYLPHLMNVHHEMS